MNAYIYDGLRTPFGRHAGALAKVRPDDLLAEVIRALIERNVDVLHALRAPPPLVSAQQRGHQRERRHQARDSDQGSAPKWNKPFSAANPFA